MVRTRKALESLYKGVCDVYEFEPSKDPVTGITRHQEQRVLEGIPCRVSFSSSPQASQLDGPASVAQVIKLFTAPEHLIRPGSKIVVVQNGRTTEYEASGQPAVYTSHQEISLSLFKGWA